MRCRSDDEKPVPPAAPRSRSAVLELKHNGGWWYPALRALTGANPVPDSARGNRALNDAAWLRWGQENGYA